MKRCTKDNLKLSKEKNYVQTKILRGDVRTSHRFINHFHSNGAGGFGEARNV